MTTDPNAFPWKLAAGACIAATIALSGFAYYLGKSRTSQAQAATPYVSTLEKPAPEAEDRVYQAPIPGTRLIRSMRVTPAGPGAIRLAVSIDFVASNRQQVPGLMGESELTILLADNKGSYSDPDGVCQMKVEFQPQGADLDLKGLCGEPENSVSESLAAGHYAGASEKQEAATTASKCPPGTPALICSNPVLATANEAVAEAYRHAYKAAQTGGSATSSAFEEVEKAWRRNLRSGCIDRAEWPDEQKSECLSESFEARIQALRHYTGVVQLSTLVASLERGGGKLRNAVDAYGEEYRSAAVELPMYYPKLRAMLGPAVDEFHDLLSLPSQGSSNLFQSGCAAEGCPSGEAAFDLDPELGAVTAAIIRDGKAKVWSTHATSTYELPGALRVWVAERTADVDVIHRSFDPPVEPARAAK